MGITQRVAGAWRFLQRGLEDFDTTASFVPSSRYLVRAMIEPIPRGAKVVVEFGSGTGTLTREILKRMAPDGVLYAVELDKSLLDASVRSVDDKRMVPVFGSAVDVATLIAKEHVGKVDAVISSLGLSLMPQKIREGIVDGARAVLAPGGVFTQYAYVHARWAAYSPGRKTWFQWDAREFFKSKWAPSKTQVVVANVPPATVFECRG